MHFTQRGGDYDLWGHKSPRPAISVSPPENLDTYVLKYDPVYDPKTGFSKNWKATWIRYDKRVCRRVSF